MGALIIAILTVITVEAYLFDGIDGSVYSAIGGAPTQYASKYTESAFRRVRIGMNREEVKRLLGDPLTITVEYFGGEFVQLDTARGVSKMDGVMNSRRDRPQSELWRYAKSPTTSPYLIRVIEFRGETVSRVVHGFEW